MGPRDPGARRSARQSGADHRGFMFVDFVTLAMSQLVHTTGKARSCREASSGVPLGDPA